MRRIAAALLTCVAALAGAGPAEAAAPAAAEGVVVQRAAAGTGFVLAGERGALVAVEGTPAPRVGARARVTGSRTAAGTLRARHVRAAGRASAARVRGVVLAREARHGRYVLAAGAASVVVRAGGGALPAVGEVVEAEVALTAEGGLRQRARHRHGRRARLPLLGTLTAVDVAAGTLTVLPAAAQGADPLAPLLVHAAPGTDLGGCAPGDEVALAVRHDARAGYVALEDPGCDAVAREDDEDSQRHEDEDGPWEDGPGDDALSDREREPDDDVDPLPDPGDAGGPEDLPAP